MGAEHKKPGQLKHLEFVRDLASQTYNYTTDVACYAYTKAKPYVPSSVDKSVQDISKKVESASKPYLAKATDTSMKTLSLADSKVDYAVSTAHSYWQGALKAQSEAHKKNVGYYLHAKDAVYKRFETSLSFLKERGLTGTAQAALEATKKQVASLRDAPQALINEAKVLSSKLQELWARIASTAPVKTVVHHTKPTVDFAWSKYLSVHDQVVAAPYYNKVVQTGSHTVNKVQETPVYKTLKNHLYPIISPIADPAYDSFSKSPLVNDVLNHLKPRTSAVH